MAQIQDYVKEARINNLSQMNLTIQAGQTQSNVYTCGALAPFGLILPSNFTTANLTFLGGLTPDTAIYPITNFDGTAFQAAGSATQWLPMLPSMFNGIPYLVVETDQTQVSTVIMQVILCPIWQGVHA